MRSLLLSPYLYSSSFPVRTLCTFPQPLHSSPSFLPPSNQLQSALTTLSTLPEIHQALQSPSPEDSQSLLHRALQITSSLSGSHSALIHSLLAQLHHSLGTLSIERTHRLHIISSLSQTPPQSNDLHLHTAHIAAAHLALSLSCLRSHGPEPTLAASAAAAQAQRLASHPILRTSATLAAAIADGPNGRATRTMLSALVAMQTEVEENGAPDIPGFARAFLALWEPDIAKRLDHAKALVVRWEHRPSFDFIEALCLAANTLIQTDVATDLDMAEDMYARAVRVAADVGGELDKGEGLLGLAQVYEKMGKIIEAEGMYRSVEERFDVVWKKKRFTVAAADLFCRAMELYAAFLNRSEVNGVKREREAELRLKKAAEVKELLPQVLGEKSVPLWTVESLLPAFELPTPTVTEGKS